MMATTNLKNANQKKQSSETMKDYEMRYFERRKQAEQNIMHIMKTMENTKALRSVVEGLVTFLSCNGKGDDEADGDKPMLADKDTEKEFLRGLQDKLQGVDHKFKEIGKSLEPVKTLTVYDSPLSWLSLDGPASKDYKAVDNCLIRQWYYKVREYSSCVVEQLQTACNETRYEPPRRTFASNKPLRIDPIQKVSNNQSLVLLGGLQRHSFLKIQLHHSQGGHKVVKIGVEKTFIAYLYLWQMHVEKVIVKGYGEQVCDEELLFLLNTPSQISLYQKITDHANCARMYFHDTAPSGSGPSYQINNLVLFLKSYHVLFSSSHPCVYCKKHMKDGLPPYIREFHRLHIISHKSCADQSFN